MNWWNAIKISQIENFDDRNRANHSIKYLSEISDTLKYASQLVFMTGRGARNMVSQLADHKVMSTYPDLVGVLHQADRIAIDNPKKFGFICNEIASKLDGIVQELTDQRLEFAHPGTKVEKGLIYDE